MLILISISSPPESKVPFDYRKSLGLTASKDTNVYRLVHAEGDDLPGLIIDYYNGVAVMQMHSVGMYRLRKEFAEILKELLGDELKAVYR